MAREDQGLSKIPRPIDPLRRTEEFDDRRVSETVVFPRVLCA
jgi:hypothetical protein